MKLVKKLIAFLFVWGLLVNLASPAALAAGPSVQVVYRGDWSKLDIGFLDGILKLSGPEGRTDYYNSLGEKIASVNYDYVYDFSEGLARVRMGEWVEVSGENWWGVENRTKWGFIDAKGREVVPLKYKRAWPFSEGLAAVYDTSALSASEYYSRIGFIDTQGQMVIPFMEADYWPEINVEFNDGRAVIMTPLTRQSEWGYEETIYTYKAIDKSGKKLFDIPYGHARQYSEGLLAVAQDGWWGIGDAEGYEKTMASSYNEGKWGFIDINGKEVIAPKYAYVSDFYDGIAIAAIGDGGVLGEYRWGAIDKRGQEVVPVIYEDVAAAWGEGRLGVVRDGLFGFVDYSGQLAIPHQYTGYRTFTSGIATVIDTEDKWGAIDRDGNEIIPFIYERLAPIGEGLIGARLESGGKFGYLDLQGKQVIPHLYDGCLPFSGGATVVVMGDDLVGIIAKPMFEGEDATDPEPEPKEEEPVVPEEPKPLEKAIEFTVGQAGYSADGKNYDMVAAYKEGDHTMVAVRMLEALGAQFKWNQATQTATFNLAGKTVVIRQDATQATVNGQAARVPVAPKNVGNRLMVPVRFISENLGLKVHWQPGDIITII